LARLSYLFAFSLRREHSAVDFWLAISLTLPHLHLENLQEQLCRFYLPFLAHLIRHPFKQQLPLIAGVFVALFIQLALI